MKTPESEFDGTPTGKEPHSATATPSSGWAIGGGVLVCQIQKESQHSVDGVRILKNLGEIGLQKNHVGSGFVGFVMLASHTVSEVVLRQHILGFVRIDLLTHTCLRSLGVACRALMIRMRWSRSV